MSRFDVKEGTTPAPVIKAQGQAMDALARTMFGGAILVVLTVAYLVTLYLKLDSAGLLTLIGTGLGFLLGGRHKTD